MFGFHLFPFFLFSFLLGQMATESREPADANEVYQMYQQMMQEINAIWSKINELDSEKHEHELVRALWQVPRAGNTQA